MPKLVAVKIIQTYTQLVKRLLETRISTLVTLDLVVVYFNAHSKSLPICLEYVSVTVTLSIRIQAKKGSLYTSCGFYGNTIYVIANCHADINTSHSRSRCSIF